MRFVIRILFLAIFCAAGCVTKKEDAERARQAYLAGQQAAAAQAAAQPSAVPDVPLGEPTVVLHGPVQHPVIAWQDGLTLSDAIVDAQYTGFMNPILIRVIRQGQVVDECKGVDLLHGHNFALESGDIIVLQ